MVRCRLICPCAEWNDSQESVQPVEGQIQPWDSPREEISVNQFFCASDVEVPGGSATSAGSIDLKLLGKITCISFIGTRGSTTNKLVALGGRGGSKFL